MEKKRFQFGYVPELDGLRGIAILAVMVFHSGLSFFRGGFIGVDIFFVLSGFLITSLLIKEYDKYQHISLKRFYLRRALRLLPALVLLLFLFSVISILVLGWAKARENLTNALIVLFYVANWARALQIHAPNLLGHAWSLSMEEQFYILWPMTLIFFLKHIRSRRSIFILITSIAILSWLFRIYLASNGAVVERLFNGLDTRADSLLIGCAVAVVLSSGLITRRQQNVLSHVLRYLAPVALLMLGAITLIADWQRLYVYYWLLTLVEILTAVLILDVFISKRSLLRIIFSNKLLVWIGSISYGVYLWHYPIFRLLDINYNHAIVLFVGTVLAFIVASCSYYFWERPFLRLKNKFSQVGIPRGEYKTKSELLSSNTVETNDKYATNSDN